MFVIDVISCDVNDGLECNAYFVDKMFYLSLFNVYVNF